MGWGRRGIAWPPLAALLVLLATAPPATAQLPSLGSPAFGNFRSVLAQGEGQSVNSADLAKYEATNQPPDTFVNQQPLYVGIMPHAFALRPPDLDRYYKNTNFGSMPGGVASTKSPPGRPGATIYRDARFGMAHIYAAKRADLMYAAGYATAEERLFLMDAVLQQAFQRRFGSRWRKPYHDLREAQDPEAFTVAKRRFSSDNPGPVRPGLNAMPDYGSIIERDAIASGPSSSAIVAQRAKLPAWARSVEGLKASLPHVESNAVMIPQRLSHDRRALAA